MSESQKSCLMYMARQTAGLWVPMSTTSRGAHEDNGDWGQGRTPQALRALVRNGYVEDESKRHVNPNYGFFGLTQKGWDEVKRIKEYEKMKVAKLSREQAFLVMAYTGCNTMNYDEFKKEVESRFGLNLSSREAIQDRVTDDFLAICFN